MSAEIDVRVVPRSSRQKVELLAGGTLKVWVHAAPAEGQANDAVCEVLSAALDVARSRVSIVRGTASRSKRIRIEDLELSEVLKRLS